MKYASRKFIVVLIAIICATTIQVLGNIFNYDNATTTAYFNLLGLIISVYCAGNTAQSIFTNNKSKTATDIDSPQ